MVIHILCILLYIYYNNLFYLVSLAQLPSAFKGRDRGDKTMICPRCLIAKTGLLAAALGIACDGIEQGGAFIAVPGLHLSIAQAATGG